MLRIKKSRGQQSFSIIEQLRINVCSVGLSRKFEVEKIQSKMGEGLHTGSGVE